jgi:hypothetical protein
MTDPVSPERLRELILHAFTHDLTMQDDVDSALRELETARARIRELERENERLRKDNDNIIDAFDATVRP